MKQFIIAAIIVIFGASAVAPVWAHGGGTDKNGCHRDHKNGGRHCH
ncbi:YHYH domain-containing protein [Allopusillimonas ginsengisoli]